MESIDYENQRLRAILGKIAGVRKYYGKNRTSLAKKVRDMAQAALWNEHRFNRASCNRCRLPYDLFPGDMIIDDDLWAEITYSDNPKGGLLCPNCIVHLLIDKLGMTVVDCKISRIQKKEE